MKTNPTPEVTVANPRLEQRRSEAAERAAERAARGDAGQLAKLVAEGHGDCKEAKKLRAKLGAEEEACRNSS